MKKIKFEQFEQGKVYYFSVPSLWRQWCCNCKTAHAWLIDIEKGKVKLTLFLDEKATELRKFYEKKE